MFFAFAMKINDTLYEESQTVPDGIKKSAPGPSHEVAIKQHRWVLAMHHSLFGLGLKAHVWVFWGEVFAEIHSAALLPTA